MDTKEYFKKNNEIQNERFKRYTVKISRDIAEIFDKKMKKNGDKFSDVARSAVDKYIRNH